MQIAQPLAFITYTTHHALFWCGFPKNKVNGISCDNIHKWKPSYFPAMYHCVVPQDGIWNVENLYMFCHIFHRSNRDVLRVCFQYVFWDKNLWLLLHTVDTEQVCNYDGSSCETTDYQWGATCCICRILCQYLGWWNTSHRDFVF